MTTWILIISLLSCMVLRIKAKAKNNQSGKRDCVYFYLKWTTQTTEHDRTKHKKDAFSYLTVRLLFTRPLKSVLCCLSSLGANKLYRLQAHFAIYRYYVVRVLCCL